jgi:hypothetical protein
MHGLLLTEAVEQIGQIGDAGFDFITMILIAGQIVGGVER